MTESVAQRSQSTPAQRTLLTALNLSEPARLQDFTPSSDTAPTDQH